MQHFALILTEIKELDLSTVSNTLIIGSQDCKYQALDTNVQTVWNMLFPVIGVITINLPRIIVQPTKGILYWWTVKFTVTWITLEFGLSYRKYHVSTSIVSMLGICKEIATQSTRTSWHRCLLLKLYFSLALSSSDNQWVTVDIAVWSRLYCKVIVI